MWFYSLFFRRFVIRLGTRESSIIKTATMAVLHPRQKTTTPKTISVELITIVFQDPK